MSEPTAGDPQDIHTLECGCTITPPGQVGTVDLIELCAEHRAAQEHLAGRLQRILDLELDEYVRAHSKGRSAKVRRIWEP